MIGCGLKKKKKWAEGGWWCGFVWCVLVDRTRSAALARGGAWDCCLCRGAAVQDPVGSLLDPAEVRPGRGGLREQDVRPASGKVGQQGGAQHQGELCAVQAEEAVETCQHAGRQSPCATLQGSCSDLFYVCVLSVKLCAYTTLCTVQGTGFDCHVSGWLEADLLGFAKPSQIPSSLFSRWARKYVKTGVIVAFEGWDMDNFAYHKHQLLFALKLVLALPLLSLAQNSTIYQPQHRIIRTLDFVLRGQSVLCTKIMVLLVLYETHLTTSARQSRCFL